MYSGQDQFIALHLPLNFTTFALQYISRVAWHSSATLYTVAYSSASGAAPLMYSGSDSPECSAVCSPIALHKFTAQNVLHKCFLHNFFCTNVLLSHCPAQIYCTKCFALPVPCTNVLPHTVEIKTSYFHDFFIVSHSFFSFSEFSNLRSLSMHLGTFPSCFLLCASKL